MKKIICFIITIIILTLCGCEQQNSQSQLENINSNNPQPLKINNTDSYNDLITTEVDIESFVQTFTKKTIYGREKIDVVNSTIGIECLRKTEKGALYSVHKIKQGGLLYIFYNTYVYESTGDISDASILRWFYVPKKLSSNELKDITKNNSTIDDFSKIDPSAAIFKYLFTHYPDRYNESTEFVSWHYLSDGILDVGYEYKNGKFVYICDQLNTDYNLENLCEPFSPKYDAHILEMDWVK